jgi:hypothetical protein
MKALISFSLMIFDSVSTSPTKVEYKDESEILPLDNDLSDKITIVVHGTSLQIDRKNAKKSGLLKTIMEVDQEQANIHLPFELVNLVTLSRLILNRMMGIQNLSRN